MDQTEKDRLIEWVGCVQERVKDLEKETLWAKTELVNYIKEQDDKLASRVAQLEEKN